MNKLILALTLALSFTAQAEEFNVKSYLDNIHVRIGVGFKTHETPIFDKGIEVRDALSARIGVWYRFNNVLSDRCYVDLGVDHHSQWSEGAPFNNRGEYMKQEWFLDGTCTLGGLL